MESHDDVLPSCPVPSQPALPCPAACLGRRGKGGGREGGGNWADRPHTANHVRSCHPRPT